MVHSDVRPLERKDVCLNSSFRLTPPSHNLQSGAEIVDAVTSIVLVN